MPATQSAQQTVARQARREIANFVDENIKQVVARLWELTAATKKAWATCPTCEKRVEVEVPDTNGAVKALEALITQGYGRPVQQAEDLADWRRPSQALAEVINLQVVMSPEADNAA